MARLIIDIAPAETGWRGRWWAAAWGGVVICVSRDPASSVARLFVRADKAKSGDRILLLLDGAEVAVEEIVSAAKRRQDPNRLAAIWRDPKQTTKAAAGW